jgi:HAE1 family hydrophobic/amphiphilic exporter-1
VLGAFDHVEDLNHIVVAMDRTRLSSALSPSESRRRKQQGAGMNEAGTPLMLSDLGQVKDTLSEVASYSRYDGRSTISLAILKQADANVVRVADDIKGKLADIRAKLPKDVQIQVVYDQSTFVKAGISGMVRDSILGGLLAFLVLVLFLGHLEDAAVVSTAIPISILSALFIMYGKGMTLNTITLAGLAIGIGHLVDGAIVVQENIARHRAMGSAPDKAAAEGGAEVFGAVTTSILTSVAVFLPLVFVSGVIGQVFRDLSWSVIFSQLVSLIVAFTVIPMMASMAGRDNRFPSRAAQRISELHKHWAYRAKDWVAAYDRLLTYALENPLNVLRGVSIACLVSVAILYFMPKAVFPEVQGHELLLRLDMPVGTPIEKTNEACLRIEESLKNFRGLHHIAATVGSITQEGVQPLGAHQAQLVLELSRYGLSTAKMTQRLKTRLEALHLGGRLFFFEQGGTFSFLGGQGAPVVVEVKGYDLSKLETVAQHLSERFQSVRGLANIRTTVSEPAPELQVEVKRDALANLSLSVADLAETVLTGVRGKVVSKFREAGKEIDIRMRLRPEDRSDLQAIESLLVHSPLDVDVPINAVAYIRPGHGPSEIIRYDQQRTVLVSADLSGRSVSAVLSDIAPLLDAYKDNSDVSLTLTGESARMAESFSSLRIILMLSIAFVFMIMASQFESLWQPLSILFTIPLALIGLAPALVLTGHKLTAMAGMGMVLLAGIVVNNGIVLVDFVNQSRAGGLSLREALRAGCHTRLRPILMTAITTILGMLPLALGIGEGADMQAPMAVVVVSGLFVSTLLTLIVLPAKKSLVVGAHENGRRLSSAFASALRSAAGDGQLFLAAMKIFL